MTRWTNKSSSWFTPPPRKSKYKPQNWWFGSMCFLFRSVAFSGSSRWFLGGILPHQLLTSHLQYQWFTSGFNYPNWRAKCASSVAAQGCRAQPKIDIQKHRLVKFTTSFRFSAHEIHIPDRSGYPHPGWQLHMKVCRDSRTTIGIISGKRWLLLDRG